MKRISLNLLLMTFFVAANANGEVIFVDNLQGSEAFDGSTPRPVDNDSGPCLTIGHALQLARPGDVINIVNNGVPYYESLQLYGRRHSGPGHVKFTIMGNGTVVSGAQTIAPQSWRRVGEDLWKVTPRRKGHYLLLLDEKPVTEHRLDEPADSLPEIPVGHWFVWRGSIYYQAERFEEPPEKPFQLAGEEVGLTLYAVRHVEIRDLTFRHFQRDGVNAHDLCRDVVLDGVTTTENGRAGVAVAGSSEVFIRNSHLVDNRIDQLRISELGVADVDEESEISAPPTVIPR